MVKLFFNITKVRFRWIERETKTLFSLINGLLYNLQFTDVGYTHVVMNLCGSYGGNQLGKIDT